ncbi:ferrichrome ABC transporter substrate-binding protein [Corallococcus sp. CA053C]|uniref:ferrichrome ABC transporter substrate-binding protein n=1 Tax=Corallococcus sp. CA053C TaxID=2316732 RepID=UPI000EA2F8B1|nr:ferrichrome ABC transporter substrate-binding protein [Corallococcus sp. CA053C]RKH09302.1 ferrichrome ABC transporter substrate-binding protein [Corallococcus sp. CA053C]
MAWRVDIRASGHFTRRGGRGKLSCVSRRSRLGLTLLLSVLLHAALFFALSRVPSVRPPRQASPSREVVEFDIRHVPEKPTARPTAPVGAPPTRRVERPAPSTPKTPAPQVATAPPAAEPGQEDTPPQEKPLSQDTPLASTERPILVPGHLLGEGLTGQPHSTGRTLRNTGEVPDKEALARQQAEEARVKVDGWAKDALAEARAESGAPAPYFAKLQKDFTKKLVDPPPPDLKVLASRAKREQLEAIERFGKTGTPYAPEKRDQRLEQRNRFQAAVEAGRAANVYMVDLTQPILALAAVVEVRQARDGKVLELEVIEGSGDSKFDAWAISQLREALASAEAPTDGGVGIHDEGMRSRWRLKEFLGNPRVQIHLIGVY